MNLDPRKVYELINPTPMSEFKRFAKRCLGITEGEIEAAEYRDPKDVHEQKYQIVYTWHLKNRRNNTADRLDYLLQEDRRAAPIQQPNEQASHSSDHHDPRSQSTYESQAHTVNESGARHETTSSADNSRNVQTKATSHETVTQQVRSQSRINTENGQALRAPGDDNATSSEQPAGGHTPPSSHGRLSESHENPTHTIEQQEETDGRVVENPSAESEEKNSVENLQAETGLYYDVRRTTDKHSRVSDSPQNMIGQSAEEVKQKLHNLDLYQRQEEDRFSESISAPCGSAQTEAQSLQNSGKTFSEENLAGSSNQKAVTNLCDEVQYMEVDSCPDDVYKQMKSNPDYYPVTEKPQKGYVFIFNNTFENVKGHNPRKGSKKDVKNLKNLWNEIRGCKVYEKINLRADQMLDVFQKFVTSTKRLDCGFVCFFIMSHGNCEYYKDEHGEERLGEGFFLGNDGKKIRIGEIMSMLENKFPGTTLRNTPKLVFFQVCRGNTLDSGIEQSCKSTASSKAVVETDSATMLPTTSDTLISYATQSGHQSLRDPKSGSWFINAIVNAFSRYAKDEHVVDLMTKVNKAVSQQSGKLKKGTPCKEMSTFTSNLRDKLYFYPGHENDDF